MSAEHREITQNDGGTACSSVRSTGGRYRYVLCTLVFFLVFLCGVLFLLWRSHLKKDAGATTSHQNASLQKSTPKTEILPPLYLPELFKGEPGDGDSWEVSGVANANFVSTRAQLTAWLQNQSWREGKVIQLGDGLNPKLLMTFEKGKYEVIVQLARRSADTTSFAYRRCKRHEEAKPGVPEAKK